MKMSRVTMHSKLDPYSIEEASIYRKEGLKNGKFGQCGTKMGIDRLVTLVTRLMEPMGICAHTCVSTLSEKG